MPRSRRPPDSPPTFFVDRNLGRYEVPNGLRAAGCTVETMHSVFGPDAEQTVADVEWLELCGREGWLALTKDDAIRRVPAELAAVAAHAVKMFCLTTAGLTGFQQVQRFVKHRHRMEQRGRKAGPFIYGVYEEQLRKLWPDAAALGHGKVTPT